VGERKALDFAAAFLAAIAEYVAETGAQAAELPPARSPISTGASAPSGRRPSGRPWMSSGRSYWGRCASTWVIRIVTVS
jgi:hypothetical protein